MPNAQNAAQAVPSMFELVLNAGPVGKLVLLLLAVASLVSWGVILAKWRTLKRARTENAGFLDVFWHSKSIEEIFPQCEQYAASPVANVFASGYKELKKLTTPAPGTTEARALDDAGVDNIARALMRASNHEVSVLEQRTGLLATVASSAPFVGLFGTVLGIIDSFQKIGFTGAANLAVVAPGISEALIATAAGIGAAIPAVVGYNHFATQIKRLVVDMDNFTQDFLNIVHRSAMSARKGN
jgi:biopolymer transport protein TolQ